MNKALKRSYNVIRSVVVTVLVLAVATYAGLYLLLSMPWVQNKIKERGEKELSEFLGTDVTIGDIAFEPFNELTLGRVNIPDRQGDSLLNIDRLGAGLSIYDLLVNRKIVITYGEIIGLHGHITRPDKDSPTNLQFIIDAFKPQPDQPPKPFDVRVNNIVLRKSDLSYDVLNEPHLAQRFDPNHIKINNLKADLELPRLKNNDFLIDLKRLSLDEQSGFMLNNLVANVAINDTLTTVSNLRIELPGSLIHPEDITLRYHSLKTMGEDLKTSPLSLKIANSYITPADFSAFAPQLASMNDKLDITLAVDGTLDRIHAPVVSIASQNGTLETTLNGTFEHLSNAAEMTVDVPYLKLQASRDEIARIMEAVGAVPANTRDIIGRLGDVSVNGSVAGNLKNIDFSGDIITSPGEVAIHNGHFDKNNNIPHVAGHIVTQGLEIGRLLAQDKLGSVALDAAVDATIPATGGVEGKLNGNIGHIDLNGYRYHNLTANVDAHQNHYTGSVNLDDPNGKISIEGQALVAGAASSYDVSLKGGGLNLATLLQKPVPIAGITSIDADAHLTGNSLSNLRGHVDVNDITFVDKSQKVINLSNLAVRATDDRVELQSPFLHGSIDGSYDLATLPAAFNNLVAQSLPSLISKRQTTGNRNDFTFNFTLEPEDKWPVQVNLPVKLVYKATVTGHINEHDGSMDALVDIPYLQQGNKIIDGSQVKINKQSANHGTTAFITTHIPSKNGKITVTVDALGQDDALKTNLGWRMDRARDYHGNINLDAMLSRSLTNRVMAQVNVNPTTIVANDTVWNVNGGRLDYDGHRFSVNHLNATCDKQFIDIHGNASSNPDDELEVALGDISLDYIFNTLQINHVTFGGRATGNFTLADLFSKEPRLMTPNLHVDNMYYNGALMGDADIESHWDNENKGVVMNCDLTQRNGEHSIIGGTIFPAADSLYFVFDANRANVKFMKPFMEAFTSDIDGEVSGHAVLFGNFKTIDLEGDVYAHNLKLKLDYTNCYYTCSDSVHIVPGYIAFDDLLIHDREGNEAHLNGYLKHDSFHDPVFNFTVSNARNFLCYDITEAMNPKWYGTIYGNGGAVVTGEPGIVKIGVNMQSAENSKFTFVLSDTEEAGDYNFITFRDRDKALTNGDDVAEAALEVDTIPDIVKLLTQRIEQQNQSESSVYLIDLQADITPEAQLILVMDPVGGDKIRANGSGNLRLNYDSTNDEFEMFGRYVLSSGKYNFTLQDIIIKDFTIREGSTISFDGDPYNAMLDIEAIYSLNANIRDLDESFATDRDINRTNVPVHTLLRIKGGISEPELSFDLEFPTLTTEAYRKVKSVISTDEMMNRQIIYLLALNRFYTPDYMNSSTSRGGELTSVASSTISSQLSNMLGQLSDNWTIAPNFRSDRGDFSDVEVDVALSSQLLNNRLLLNGNIGYRDNTYNTNNSNFIGDFDLEYLLNRQGTIRLKAYNHFNDQSYYYVRNAMTTQGVGIVFKHDFDNLLKFRPRKEAKDSVPQKPAALPDSVPQAIPPAGSLNNNDEP